MNWREIFERKNPRWFHTGGVFTGLSKTTPATALEAVKIAKENGAIVSYDLNYRASLWKNRGGIAAANKQNRKILPFADVVFGVLSGDFKASVNAFESDKFQAAAEAMRTEYPNLRLIVSTLRDVHSASRHSFGAAAYADGRTTVAASYLESEVYDRIGSGDAFVSGFIYALLNDRNLQYALDCGTAHGVLAMTTAGDNSTATLEEIEHLMSGAGAAVKR